MTFETYRQACICQVYRTLFWHARLLPKKANGVSVLHMYLRPGLLRAVPFVMMHLLLWCTARCADALLRCAGQVPEGVQTHS